MRGIVWFRNDVRLHDNPSVISAQNECDEILYVYILNPRLKEESALGFPKMGVFRERFLLESLCDLSKSIKQKNADLLVLEGNSAEILADLARTCHIKKLYFQAEIASEEKEEELAVQTVLSPLGVSIKRHFNSVLYSVSKLPFPVNQVPDVFTVFRKQVESKAHIEAPLESPYQLKSFRFDGLQLPKQVDIESRIQTLPKPDIRTAFPFKGGEKAGLERIEQYFFETETLKSYKEIRNGMTGTEYSSKLSPYLALGCVSPRKVVQEVIRFEKERVKNESTYWIIFELLWREYWRYAFLKHGNRYFFLKGISPENQPWKQDLALFEAWKLGKTGFPLVDACMRELKQTGWMSNRGRQIVASFFAKNLEIDWRWGAAWFESQLVDYDVYSNWGNWAYVAGVGNDGRDRYFNLKTQAEKYDAQGKFIKLWCPELNPISGETVGVLHQLSEQERVLFRIDEIEYPLPVIDLEKSYQKLNKKK